MISVVASVAKKFRELAEKNLIKVARSTMTVERFSTELVEFLNFLKKFIESADDDQKSELNSILQTLQSYGQTIVSIAKAFEFQKLEEAEVGFDSINQKVERIETAIEFLKLDDPEALIMIDDNEEFDVEEKINELLDLGKSVVKDKLTDEQLALVKELEEDEKSGEEEDAAEIANMLGYRPEGSGNEFSEEAGKANEQRNKDREKYLQKIKDDPDHKYLPLKIQRLRSLKDVKTQEEFFAKKEKYQQALKEYENKVKQWGNTYYRTSFKNSPKYESLLKKNDNRDIERIESYHKINSLSLTDEELKFIEETAKNEPNKLINVTKITGKKKVPAKQLWETVQKNRANLTKLRAFNPELFDKIKERADQHVNRRQRQSKRYEEKEKQQVANKSQKQKDKRLEKLLKDLSSKTRGGFSF